MINDLMGGDPVPVKPNRRIVTHQPAEVPLVSFPTLGDARRPSPADIRKAAPHVRGNQASLNAARSQSNARLVGKRLELLKVCCEHFPGGATDNQLIGFLVKDGWSQNGVRPRRVELSDAGWLEPAGTDGKSTIWKASQAALEWYAGQK
jgi:hypothetical protein